MRMLLDIFGQTLRTLWAHKLRSFLTMFGIAWGVGSLLLLAGVGEGFRNGNRRQLETFGKNIIFFYGGRAPAVEGSFTSMKWFNLTYADYLAIKNQSIFAVNIAPLIARDDIRAVSDYTSTNGQVSGVPPIFSRVRTIPLQVGRWINDEDNDQRRRVCVLGREMTRNLFPGRPAVGNTILLNGVHFEVIGMLSMIGNEEQNSTNIRIFVPFNTMRELFPLKGENSKEGNAISFINYQPRTFDDNEAAKDELHRIVARNHGGFDPTGKDTWEEWDTVKNQKTMGKIFTAMDWFLGGVGLITLALGAIGIINIMLVAVTERTREIGLRKALGATNRAILFQFFLEGACLTLVSGALGVGAAMLVVHLLSGVNLPQGFDTPRIVPVSAITAVLSLAIAGITAGLYPARKAAMLEPVEALRQE
ncbi:MAG TPA: ABC transporter permease [Candidatus Sulfotelmatobacter sp.]|jgi:putative ABC transport system permease protein|nr:ABC transporter permease [Candidatus Sulfotelmatobacter sp.]